MVTGQVPLYEQYGEEQGSSSLSSYTDVFYKQLPFYIAIGMSEDAYWNEDCTKVIIYREAFKYSRQIRNYEFWLQGRYIYEAIANLSPILVTNFSKKKIVPKEYPKEPYVLDGREAEEKAVRESMVKQEKMKNAVSQWAKKVNEKHLKNNEKGVR